MACPAAQKPDPFAREQTELYITHDVPPTTCDLLDSTAKPLAPNPAISKYCRLILFTAESWAGIDITCR